VSRFFFKAVQRNMKSRLIWLTEDRSIEPMSILHHAKDKVGGCDGALRYRTQGGLRAFIVRSASSTKEAFVSKAAMQYGSSLDS
jgi:hypothetical protein